MSLSNMTITLPSLLVPLSVTLYHHETCMHSLCVFVSDHKQDLCFASKVSHKSRMPVFSLRQSIKKVLQCVTNVLFFWFALLLFVNPGKLTLPLNICATSDVLICSIFLSAFVCTNDGERVLRDHEIQDEKSKNVRRHLSHWRMTPSWELKHGNQMVDRKGNRTLLMNRMTVRFTFTPERSFLFD